MHDACIIQIKRCVYFLEFFNYNVLKMGVFMVKPALSGHPQKRGNIKNDEKCYFMP